MRCYTFLAIFLYLSLVKCQQNHNNKTKRILLDGLNNYIIQQELNVLKQEVANLKTKVSTDQNRITELESKLQNVTQQPSVTFMAELGKTLNNPATGRHLIFDTVHVNIGNGYNNRHGIFTAPVTGTYHFAVELTIPGSSSSREEQVFLMKKNEKIGYIFNGGVFPHAMKRSVSTVVYLNAGDDVYVIVGPVGGTHSIYGCCLHSTFTGFLIAVGQ